MTDALWVYVTAADRAEAARIGRACVEERLAACANILPGHSAIYRWQGRIEEAEEGALVLKTTAARFVALRARIRALSSYTTPCILALPAAAGDADFLSWLREQVAPAEG
ncbi:MAG: divalent-cation tolerance protein CutA [Acetobacteraceae bacterium]|nr:divalent-cation tolerance protein CutA [Acetobacteraceae bacterium]